MIDRKQVAGLISACLDDYKKESRRMVLIHNNGKGEHSAIPRKAHKFSRNKPCPCGSGKKFKKCHGGINRQFPKYPEPIIEEILNGEFEGEQCNRDGCKGIIENRESDYGCSCHINPPCSSCTSQDECCPECGWEAEDV